MSTPSSSWPREVLRRPRTGETAPRTSKKIKILENQLLAPRPRASNGAAGGVTFEQHIGGNCIRRCSKCHFMIACTAECVAISSCDRGGAIPTSLSVNSQGDIGD